MSLPMIAGIIWKVEALPTPLGEEQEQEAGEEAREGAGLVLDADEVDDADDADRHRDEHPAG